MPKEVYNVNPVSDLSVESINRLVADLNNALVRLSDEIATVEGVDGRLPVFENDVNFSGKRLCNVGRTKIDSDVPSRKELVDRAMYVRADTKKHQADVVIVANKGIEVPFAVESTQAPNLQQLLEAVENIDLTAEVIGILPVGNGGTGASTLTDGGILIGSGTGALTALGVATNGQIPIGDGTTDPVLAVITGTANKITVTNGAGTITLTIPDAVTLVTLTLSGDLNHDGTNIGFYGTTPVAQSSAYSPTNVSTDRAYDADSTTINELADILGTLITDLQATGIIG